MVVRRAAGKVQVAVAAAGADAVDIACAVEEVGGLKRKRKKKRGRGKYIRVTHVKEHQRPPPSRSK